MSVVRLYPPEPGAPVHARPGAARGIRHLDERGDFSEPTRVSWRDGVFEIGGAPQPGDLAGAGLWLIPGLIDAHLHAAWHAFDVADRSHLSAEQTLAATTDALARTLASGFTSVRDAGGLTPGMLANVPCERRPRVQLSVRIIDRTVIEEAGGVDRAVEQVLEAGAGCIKLYATGGVGTPTGEAIEATLTAAEIRDAVRRADRAGVGAMVHAWGGQAIDDAIEAGALSIEHGIFITDEQAERAADRGMTLVPTLRIYRLVSAMIERGSLPAALRTRVDEAIGAHPAAVLRARDAGLPIALGTDYGTPDQHGTGALEFDALVEAGLTPQEALLAATRSGARLLAFSSARDRGTGVASGASNEVPSGGAVGTVSTGAVADGVILRRDPREPGALAGPDSIVAVIKEGRWIGAGGPLV